VDLMLLGTVLLWALNITVTKYVLRHGFHPLAYAVIRYGSATALFWCVVLLRERTLWFARRDLRLVLTSATLIVLNQLCFIYSVKLTTAATVALILGATPVFAGLITTALGIERPASAFWLAATLSFAGVALVAAGSGGVSTSAWGDVLAVATSATWAAYSVSITPLMQRYSASRISAVVLALGWIPLAGLGARQIAEQSFHFGSLTWVGFGYAVVGPLFLTNILWFTSVDRVGPSRATLFANLQPFFAVVFALLLLSERITTLQIAGGFLIASGIVGERRSHRRAQTRAQLAGAEP
jgi:drug/metabolite transporter (DMT)-like permease